MDSSFENQTQFAKSFFSFLTYSMLGCKQRIISGNENYVLRQSLTKKGCNFLSMEFILHPRSLLETNHMDSSFENQTQFAKSFFSFLTYSMLGCKQRIISGNENYILRHCRTLRLVSQKRGIIFFPWNSYCIQGVCWKSIIWIPVLRTRLSLQNPFFLFLLIACQDVNKGL